MRHVKSKKIVTFRPRQMESQISVERTWPDSSRVSYGLLWIGLALVGMVAFYWTGLASLLDAWSRPEYSHGYLIAPIALYLFLVQLNNEGKDSGPPPARRKAGVAVVFLGLAVGLLGNLVHIPDVITYGFIVCIAGLVLITLGTSRGLKFWAPVAYLVFMLPLPNLVIYRCHLSCRPCPQSLVSRSFRCGACRSFSKATSSISAPISCK